MKCPKCGYLGFERVERCRNCGYDFPVVQSRTMPELPLKGVDADHLGLLDLELGNDAPAQVRRETPASIAAMTPPPPEPSREDEETSSADDLPLFEPSPTDMRSLGARPLPSRPPLSVRRGYPEVPRVRSEQPRTPMLDLGPVESSPSVSRDTGLRGHASSAIREPATDLAGLGARVAAGLVDVLVLLAVDSLVVYFTMKICGITSSEIALMPVAPLAAFLLLQNAGYLIAFTAGGQTLGKMALGIRVVSADEASRIDLGRSVKRTALWLLMAVPAGLGFVSLLLDRDRRGWHDRGAGTRVVRTGAA